MRLVCDIARFTTINTIKLWFLKRHCFTFVCDYRKYNSIHRELEHNNIKFMEDFIIDKNSNTVKMRVYVHNKYKDWLVANEL